MITCLRDYEQRSNSGYLHINHRSWIVCGGLVVDMSLVSHIEDELTELSYAELKVIALSVQEQLNQYKKESTYSIPNYSFEEL
jgi:hypothetical protein